MSPRLVFQQSVTSDRGTWRFWAMGMRVGVILTCPDCGNDSTLVHEVRTNGDVEPSVVCRHRGCTFHAFIHLEDWPGLFLRCLT